MKNLLQLFLILGLFAIAITSCKKDASKNKAAKLDAFKVRVDSLRYEVDRAWDTMVYEDNKKLDYLKRMVDEAVYVLNVSEVDQQKLHNDVEALRSFRYDRQTMANSDLIDAYDNATDSTIVLVFSFVDSLENADQVPLIADLHTDIMELDRMVIHRRGHYDEPAMELNRIFKDKKKLLNKLGDPYSKMEPYPLFVLMPDI